MARHINIALNLDATTQNADWTKPFTRWPRCTSGSVGTARTGASFCRSCGYPGVTDAEYDAIKAYTYDPAEDADSELVSNPPEEPMTVSPTHGESPARCDMCGEVLHPDDELGEFVSPYDAHMVGHSQCGLDRGWEVA